MYELLPVDLCKVPASSNESETPDAVSIVADDVHACSSHTTATNNDWRTIRLGGSRRRPPMRGASNTIASLNTATAAASNRDEDTSRQHRTEKQSTTTRSQVTTLSARHCAYTPYILYSTLLVQVLRSTVTETEKLRVYIKSSLMMYKKRSYAL